MYRIKVIDVFSSAHKLTGYKGKCEEVHGHNWKVEVGVEGNELDEIGLLVDFSDLKDILSEILKELDHCMLNNLDAFKDTNPSSELLARYIYNQVKNKLPSNTVMSSVSVWESEKSMACYTES